MHNKLQITQLLPKNNERWDEYVNAHPEASIYHLAAWCSVIGECFGHECCHLMARNSDNQVVGVLPLVHMKSLLFGSFMVSMPYFNYGGPLADNVDIVNQLMAEAVRISDNKKVKYIQFRSLKEASELKVKTRTDKVNMVLELPESTEALGKSIGSKRRSQIKRPQRENVKSVFGGIELLDDFYSVFCVNMRDLGTPVYARSFFKAILTQFPADAHVCVVYWDDKPVSTGFLLRYRDGIEIPWASTLREANRISINMYLYWEVLTWAIACGAKTFDFGRSTIDAGTYKFKKQWGAKPSQCYWHHYVSTGQKLPNLSPSNHSFSLAIKIWQKLPLPLTNRLGPMIVKNLP